MQINQLLKQTEQDNLDDLFHALARGWKILSQEGLDLADKMIVLRHVFLDAMLSTSKPQPGGAPNP